MEQPNKNEGEEPVRSESARQTEARRNIQQYIDDLRELIVKLRGRPH